MKNFRKGERMRERKVEKGRGRKRIKERRKAKIDKQGRRVGKERWRILEREEECEKKK